MKVCKTIPYGSERHSLLVNELNPIGATSVKGSMMQKKGSNTIQGLQSRLPRRKYRNKKYSLPLFGEGSHMI